MTATWRIYSEAASAVLKVWILVQFWTSSDEVSELSLSTFSPYMFLIQEIGLKTILGSSNEELFLKRNLYMTKNEMFAVPL